MTTFEEKLKDLAKPSVPELQHQELLGKAIQKAGDQTVLSIWWLAIPLYVLAAFLMKAFFMPGSSWFSNIRDYNAQQPFSAFFLFLVIPVLFIVLNGFSFRKLSQLTGSPGFRMLLMEGWPNLFLILVSLVLIFFYFI